MTQEYDADVLIVGAGPCGLAAAIEIAGRGHSVIIVEKEDRVGRQPRAKTTNVRSMEHMRRWGIAEKVRAASPLPADHRNAVLFATGLQEHVVATFENAFNADRDRDPRFSESAQWIPQYEVEAVLRDHALSFPTCELRFGQELQSLTQDECGVTADLAASGTGAAGRLRARYLVGADGARSRVRPAIGATMEGRGRIGNFLSLVLRVPGLGAAKRLPDALMYWLINPASPGIVGPMDRDDTWFWGAQMPHDGMPDAAALAERVRKTLPDGLSFEILVTDVWSALSLQADTYGSGRVYLAGDACHLHPPFGGYGMNLGIADAVDLGWKLAATLEGWGGPGLLPSYEVERRPIHARVIAESVENMGALVEHFLNPELAAEGERGETARRAAETAIVAGKDREFHSLGLVLGYDYAGSPMLVADGKPRPEPSVSDYVASASPGRRAPHAWLPDGASLFDRFGPGFTLLQTGGGADDARPMMEASAQQSIPLAHVSIPDLSLRDLYGADFALIRPDQHVAWRGDTCAGAAGILDVARGAAAS